jgi:NADH dehydrogenase
LISGNGPARPTVVVVGAGFGGLQAARRLEKTPVQVVVIDRNNYHLFQPLLYQIATAGLSPGEIAHPVRAILRRQKNFQFRLAEVEAVDFQKRILQTTTGPVSYDYLVLAVGSETNYFGMDSVRLNGFDLKDLDDAIAIRNHILTCFEIAAQESDREKRRALLTFVIVGGGPTGVECAGAISELIRLVLVKEFPELDFSEVQVVLVEALERLLGGFPENLQQEAEEVLEEKDVDVRLKSMVSGFDGYAVGLKGEAGIPARTLIWAAGVRARRLIDRLGEEQARQGRIPVKPTLQLRDHPEVFVIGDAAYVEFNGEPLPMMAPVAIQQGGTAAENIQRLIEGRTLVDFIYKDPGSLATIGRNKAVARIGRFKFSGFLAWMVWLAVHIFWLIGFRNRLIVMVNWIWDYIFYERAARLITPYGRRNMREGKAYTPTRHDR